jgi:hypothetical protein
MTRAADLRRRFAALARDLRRAARQTRGGRVCVDRSTNIVSAVNAGEPGAVRHASSVQHLVIPQGKEADPPR